MQGSSPLVAPPTPRTTIMNRNVSRRHQRCFFQSKHVRFCCLADILQQPESNRWMGHMRTFQHRPFQSLDLNLQESDSSGKQPCHIKPVYLWHQFTTAEHFTSSHWPAGGRSKLNLSGGSSIQRVCKDQKNVAGYLNEQHSDGAGWWMMLFIRITTECCVSGSGWQIWLFILCAALHGTETVAHIMDSKTC